MPASVDRPWPELPPKSTGPYARLKEGLSDPRVRRWLRVAGLVLLGAVGLVIVLGTVLFATRTYSFDTATFPPAAVRGLDVDSDVGEVSAIGSDRPDTLALWQLRYSLIKPRLERAVSDGTLRLRSRCPATSFRCAVILGSQVPRQTAVSVRTRAASVTVQDVRAPVAVTTRSGAVTVDHVTARVRIDSASGPVTLSGTAGDLAARTVSAPIEVVDTHGRADLSTDSGPITGNAQAVEVFQARTGSGWVTANFDAPPQRVEVRSASGEVDVRVPAGPYRLELRAPAGRVRLEGVSSDPSATRVIRITTGGGIHISAS
jgi:hypothetical protein